jgi:lipopolysaccharide transport system permease protein
VTVVANALLNFSIVFGLFTLFLLITGNFPGWVYFAQIPVLAILVVFSIGLGISLGVLNVFFRDIGQFFGIVIQFWFWFTPVIYPVTILPEYVRSLMSYNPMANLIGAFQAILVTGQWPVWQGLLPITILAIAMCALGMHLFHKHAGDMVDEL